MKVLLTGASGFVGSHILDVLLARGLPTAVLLRESSSARFLGENLSKVEVRTGSITDQASLRNSLQGITHVIHCAGCTKASRPGQYQEINRTGAANVVDAVNGAPD
ncbi:MAG: NAD-dependent epimerase/dehydratase family protein, partial [Limisphaerales bacterium]